MTDIPHLGFIVAAYAIAAAAIAAMIAMVWLDYLSLGSELAALEAERRDNEAGPR